MEVKTIEEVTSVFWECEQYNEVLNGLDDKIIWDTYDSGMDGVFPNRASWTKFCERVDNGELTKWIEYKTKDQYIKSIDYETIEYFCKTGIKVATGYLFDENGRKIFIYDTYTKITFKIDYDWLFSRHCGDYADIIDIYASIEKLEK